jgi:hypothetical protein
MRVLKWIPLLIVFYGGLLSAGERESSFIVPNMKLQFVNDGQTVKSLSMPERMLQSQLTNLDEEITIPEGEYSLDLLNTKSSVIRLPWVRMHITDYAPDGTKEKNTITTSRHPDSGTWAKLFQRFRYHSKSRGKAVSSSYTFTRDHSYLLQIQALPSRTHSDLFEVKVDKENDDLACPIRTDQGYQYNVLIRVIADTAATTSTIPNTHAPQASELPIAPKEALLHENRNYLPSDVECAFMSQEDAKALKPTIENHQVSVHIEDNGNTIRTCHDIVVKGHQSINYPMRMTFAKLHPEQRIAGQIITLVDETGNEIDFTPELKERTEARREYEEAACKDDSVAAYSRSFRQCHQLEVSVIPAKYHAKIHIEFLQDLRHSPMFTDHESHAKIGAELVMPVSLYDRGHMSVPRKSAMHVNCPEGFRFFKPEEDARRYMSTQRVREAIYAEVKESETLTWELEPEDHHRKPIEWVVCLSTMVGAQSKEDSPSAEFMLSVGDHKFVDCTIENPLDWGAHKAEPLDRYIFAPLLAIDGSGSTYWKPEGGRAVYEGLAEFSRIVAGSVHSNADKHPILNHIVNNFRGFPFNHESSDPTKIKDFLAYIGEESIGTTGFYPACGGTDFDPVFEKMQSYLASLAESGKKVIPVIVFLSDGGSWNDNFKKRVYDLLRTYPETLILPVGVTHYVNRNYMKFLAELGSYKAPVRLRDYYPGELLTQAVTKETVSHFLSFNKTYELRTKNLKVLALSQATEPCYIKDGAIPVSDQAIRIIARVIDPNSPVTIGNRVFSASDFTENQAQATTLLRSLDSLHQGLHAGLSLVREQDSDTDIAMGPSCLIESLLDLSFDLQELCSVTAYVGVKEIEGIAAPKRPFSESDGSFHGTCPRSSMPESFGCIEIAPMTYVDEHRLSSKKIAWGTLKGGARAALPKGGFGSASPNVSNEPSFRPQLTLYGYEDHFHYRSLANFWPFVSMLTPDTLTVEQEIRLIEWLFAYFDSIARSLTDLKTDTHAYKERLRGIIDDFHIAYIHHRNTTGAPTDIATMMAAFKTIEDTEANRKSFVTVFAVEPSEEGVVDTTSAASDSTGSAAAVSAAATTGGSPLTAASANPRSGVKEEQQATDAALGELFGF